MSGSPTRPAKHHMVVFGHSHVWSMRLACNRGWTHPDVSVEVPVCGTKELPGPLTFQTDNGKNRLNPIIMALMHKHAAGEDTAETWMICMVQGNYYNQVGMLVEGDLFDFILSSQPDLPLEQDAIVLPEAAVRDALKLQMASLNTALPALANSPFGTRTILVGPPPPMKGTAEIEKKLATMAEGSTGNLFISPAAVRLKLWHLQNEIASGMCQSTSISYHKGGMHGTTDEDGYLKQGLVKDAPHANHKYASELLSALATRISAPPQESPT